MKLYRSVLSAAVVGCGIAGLVYGHAAAKNVFLFFAWFAAITVLLASCNKEARLALMKKGRTMPRIVTATVDATTIVLLVAYGHFVIGALFMLSALVGDAVFEGAFDKEPSP